MAGDQELLKRLLDLGAVVWVGTPGTKSEFTRPNDWPNLGPADNDARLKAFRVGTDCISLNTGLPITTVDVDTQNGGDVDKMRKLLADLKVVVLAEVATPGGGVHFDVPGHPDLPTTHSTVDNGKLPDHPGVDIQSFGANVFLPGTVRPKYNGRGYTVVFNDLDQYDPADPAQKAGAEALADWVATQRTKTVKTKARKASGEWKLSPPWNGDPLDARQQGYLDKVLADEAAKVAKAQPGSRNETLFTAALKCGSYVAGAGLPEQTVIAKLQKADARPSATATDIHATNATIRSGLRGGKQNPRAVPRNFFHPNIGLLTLDLAEAVMDSVACGFGYPDRQFYTYADGVWQPDEDSIRAEIARLLNNRHRTSHAGAVLEHIQYSSGTAILTDKPLSQYINLPNGMLDWKTRDLLPHSPDFLSTVQLPVEYDPAATCPQFEVFLSEVLPPDLFLPTVDGPGFIWELIGYCLYSGNPLQVAILLHGAGRNGKGVLIRVIEALLGPRNCSNVGLHELVENRFRAATLYGKLANLAGDLDAKWLDNTAKFKAITGGDGIQAERKYGAAFDFDPWALPFYSINKPFGSADSSEGWVARWIIVPFPNSFIGREDRGLGARLTTPAELRGILARGIAALPSLMARGRFLDMTSLTEAKAAFVVASDAVRAWVNEYCDLDPGLWGRRTELYQKYAYTAAGDGSKPLSSREFYNRLGQIAGIRAVKRGSDGFVGIGLKSRKKDPPAAATTYRVVHTHCLSCGDKLANRDQITRGTCAKCKAGSQP